MEPIRVAPDEARPTHHISLTDGEKTIGLLLVDDNNQQDELAFTGNPMDRTPLKFSEGNQKYSDMVYPWSTIAQESWINGRGQKDFETDSAAFFDSRRLWSMEGELKIAGLEHYTTGLRNQDQHETGSVKWIAMMQNQTFMAYKFTASASYSVVNIYLWIRRVGTPTTAITVSLCSDSTGNPGAVLQSTTIDTGDITDILAEYYKAQITAQAITSGTAYWIMVTSADGTTDNHWKIGAEDTSGVTKQSADGTTWVAAGFDMYFRATDADTTAYTYKLFQYRYQQWLIQNKGDGTQPALWVHGDFGVADPNTDALTTLVDASKSDIWVNDEFIGCIVWVIKGTGSTEERPYRTIIDNDTTTLTVDTAWKITHDTTTEYIIIGGPAKWRVIAASNHNLATKDVTDVKVFNQAMYFCQGDATNIKRVQWYQASNALTWRSADDGTNKAFKLDTMLDNTNGQIVWKANKSDASGLNSVARAARPTTWANMTFGTAIPVNEDTGNILNIKSYNDQGTVNLWVWTEGYIYKINNDKLDPIPLEELRTFMFYRNAQKVITHNVYLIFPWGNGSIERYYDLNIDDVGPNRKEGMPSGRQGPISALEPHPGKYMCAIDAGDSGISSVLFNNGTDNWHEVYRAPAAGERIWDVQTQVIPGGPSRMWIAMGSDILWIPIPYATVKPDQDSTFECGPEAVCESGWMHAGMPDVWKFFHSFKIWADNLAPDVDRTGGIDVEIQYKYDTDDTWRSLSDKFSEMPSQEVKIKEILGVNAKRMKYRAILRTNNKSITPIIKSIVMENAMRIQIKYAFSFRVRVADNDVNALGQRDEQKALEKMDQIKEWMDGITPLYLRTLDDWSDKKTIFLNPIPYKKTKKSSKEWVLQAVAVEI